MRKHLQKLKKKDQGIALIISIFFLVIFFTLGTFLLFRTSLSKRTTNAIANNSLSENNVEGVIGAVRANLSMANINQPHSSTRSIGTSLVFEGKMNKSTLHNDRSDAYTLHSVSTDSLNDTSSNVSGKNTHELFEFNYNGLDINGIDQNLDGAPNPEWVLSYSSPSQEVGSDLIRYSYLVLDQTGKVNPNFANTAILKGDGREGFDTEIYKEAQAIDSTKASAIYDLSSIFFSSSMPNSASAPYALNRFNNIDELNGILTEEPYLTTISDFSTASSTGVLDESDALISRSSEQMAHELLYPYTQPLTYAEKPNIFNLAYLDSDAFQALADEDKVSAVVSSIPYLSYMPSEDYDPNDKEQPTAQREFVAASLIDLVDDNIISTHNYGFYEAGDPDRLVTYTSDGVTKTDDLTGKPWSFDKWLKETSNKPYAGFEGLYIGQTSFQMRAYNKTRWNYNKSSEKYRSHIFRTFFVIAPEVYCAYDLAGTPIEDIIAQNPKYAGGRLLYYARMRLDFKTANVDSDENNDGNIDVADWVEKRNTGATDLNKEYTNQKVEVVSPVVAVDRIGRIDYSNVKHRSYEAYYKPGTPYKYMYYAARNIYGWGTGNTDRIDPVNDKGAAYYQNWGCVIHSMHPDDRAEPREQEDGTFVTEEGALVYSDAVLNGTDNSEVAPNGIQVKGYVHSTKLKIDSPVLIFLDLPDSSGKYNSKPDPGEIVSITTPVIAKQEDDGAGLPDDYYLGYSEKSFGSFADPLLAAAETRSFANRNTITAVVSGDPRLGYLPSSSYEFGDSWIYSYAKNGEYEGNAFTKNHMKTDHFGSYNLKTGGDSDQRYPTVDELKFTFPKFDNEVVLPGSSDSWTSLASNLNLNLNLMVDNLEQPLGTTTTESLILNSNNLDNYVPNRHLIDYNNDGDYNDAQDGVPEDAPGITSNSSFSLPLRDDGAGNYTGFGGINMAADIGKICRGEHWRTLNISQYNIGLLNAPTDSSKYKYAGVKSTYNEGFDSSLQTTHPTLGSVPMLFPFNRRDSAGEVDDLVTDYASDASNAGSPGTLLNGGDAAIMDQVGFDEVNKDSASITLPQKTIYGVFNPNTAYPLAVQSLFSGIKINRKDFSTKTYLKGQIEDERNPALPLWKSAALTSNFYKLITNNLNNIYSSSYTGTKLAPFDRKYSFSNSLNSSPGDSSYTEGFNVTTVYDGNSRTYMNGEQRVGSFRWGNIFANKSNYYLSDVERELLYTNTKEFISVRYNYFSAIVLVEFLKVAPDSSTGDRIVTINSSGDKASLKSHYKVRAELVQDIITNEVKILDYKILN